jgi:hypothetical protein
VVVVVGVVVVVAAVAAAAGEVGMATRRGGGVTLGISAGAVASTSAPPLSPPRSFEHFLKISTSMSL